MTTTAHNRVRLLVPAALAVSATTAAAPTSSATTAEQSITSQSHQAPAKSPKAMLDAWLRLWNGDFTQASGIIPPDFTLHAALLDGGDGSSIRGADGLARL